MLKLTWYSMHEHLEITFFCFCSLILTSACGKFRALRNSMVEYDDKFNKTPPALTLCLLTALEIQSRIEDSNADA